MSRISLQGKECQYVTQMKPNSNPSISDELCWDFFVGGDFVLSIFRMEEQWYNLNNLIEEGGTHMTERTYLAIDLNNAEEKEMPISFGST